MYLSILSYFLVIVKRFSVEGLGSGEYSLVEYDLSYESLKAMKGQAVADYHWSQHWCERWMFGLGMPLVTVFWRLDLHQRMWDRLCYDISQWCHTRVGSTFGVCLHYQSGGVRSTSSRFGVVDGHESEACTGMGWFTACGAASVRKKPMSRRGIVLLSRKCRQSVEELDTFHISHVCRERNRDTNSLAQQASRYEVRWGKFWIKEEAAICDMMVVQNNESVSAEGGHTGMKGSLKTRGRR
jgi:hypothetical protein